MEERVKQIHEKFVGQRIRIVLETQYSFVFYSKKIITTLVQGATTTLQGEQSKILLNCTDGTFLECDLAESSWQLRAGDLARMPENHYSIVSIELLP